MAGGPQAAGAPPGKFLKLLLLLLTGVDFALVFVLYQQIAAQAEKSSTDLAVIGGLIVAVIVTSAVIIKAYSGQVSAPFGDHPPGRPGAARRAHPERKVEGRRALYPGCQPQRADAGGDRSRPHGPAFGNHRAHDILLGHCALQRRELSRLGETHTRRLHRLLRPAQQRSDRARGPGGRAGRGKRPAPGGRGRAWRGSRERKSSAGNRKPAAARRKPLARRDAARWQSLTAQRQRFKAPLRDPCKIRKPARERSRFL